VKIEWKKYPADIIICLVWSIAILPAVILDLEWVRIVLGLAFILFIPGYVLVFSLFPGRDSIDIIERIALSFGLSIAIVPLVGLVLNYTPWGIRLQPILISLISLVFILSAIGWYRWQCMPPKRRFFVSINIHLPKSESRLENVLTTVLIAAIVISISLLIYVIVTPHVGESFTEFYLLGPDGKAEGYPTNLSVGENGTVTIGIANHEHKQMNYMAEVWAINYSYQPEFDGKNDYVDCGNGNNLNITNVITVEAWVYNQEDRTQRIPISKGAYKNNGWYWWIDTSGWRVFINRPGSVDTISSGYTVPLNEWHHLTAVIDNINLTISFYVDGSHISTKSMSFAFSGNANENLYLGRYHSSGYNWHGILDDIRIYGRGLTENEVHQNYNGNVTTSGLVSEWDFNEGTVGIAKDSKGTNNATIYGVRWQISGINNMWFMDKIEVKLDSTPVSIEGEWKPQWEYNYSFNITKEGRFKVAFLLFRDDIDNFTKENDYPEKAERLLHAYRECHLWITVQNAPTANFTYSPDNPTTTDTVYFIDSSSDSDGSVVNWTWNFGDGNSRYLQNPTHSYIDDRIYNVTLIVRDNDGATDTTSKQITILKTQYTLKTSVTPPGSGTITLNPSGGTYDEGTAMTVTAHANTGYEFGYWSGTKTGSINPVQITMDSNKNIVAHFIENPPIQPPTVTITSPSGGTTVSGMVSIEGAASDTDGTVQSVHVKIDYGSWVTATGTTSWSYLWNTAGVSDGSYTIHARSYDGTYYSTIDHIIINVNNSIQHIHAIRSMPSSIDLGATFDVTLTASGYGSMGQINETLPAGFIYIASSLPSYHVTEWSSGVTFTLRGESTFTYTVTAPGTAGDYVFSGILKDEDKIAYAVGGDNTVTVGVIPGDLNNDDHVNVLDMTRIENHWGETGAPGWIPEDLNKDGVINEGDMVVIGQNWTG